MLEPTQVKFDFSSPPPAGPGRAQSPNMHPSDGAGFNSNPSGGYQQTNEQGWANTQQQDNGPVYKGAHPVAAGFHVAFKIAALLTFILGGIFSSNRVLIFVITILFVSADFWTTKNISGRLLVSLRWWNEIREDGSSHWVFESAPDIENRVNSFDRWIFWTTTGGNFAFWVLLVLFNFMSMTQLPMAILGAVLAGANFVGFIKCSQDAKKRIAQYMFSQATK
ncbi:hypothetical protein TRVL_03056 [Trypanosoma vivax]|uniref:Golgi apparatus membrane protein TVP23 homolog n=1 Tax=Trypanosoma vivax (strain Y486) TaxID=1055687 RepID=G0TRY4_TRYVY|nr:hypothetical protein TRVL_03056 [Trypanosoma vivax]CCC46708.1 conserved hypothetical protein [Trypanosoma vivax Y486]